MGSDAGGHPRSQQCFEHRACFGQRIAALDLARPVLASLGGPRIVEQQRQLARDTVTGEPARDNPARNSEPPQTRRVVRLIEPERHRQLRNSGGECLCGRADAGVMHDGGTAGKHLGKGRIFLVTHMRSRAPGATDPDSRSETTRDARRRLVASRAARKNAAAARFAEPGVKRIGGGPASRNSARSALTSMRITFVVERESRKPELSRPVRLYRREPVRKQTDDPLWRVQPLLEHARNEAEPDVASQAIERRRDVRIDQPSIDRPHR